MELAASESNIERQGSTLEYTYTRPGEPMLARVGPPPKSSCDNANLLRAIRR